MGPRDPSDIYPFNWLDLARTAAWSPPNLPLFGPPAPAPTDAPVAASAPADGAPPWLQPLHDIQRVAGTFSPSLPDLAPPYDIAASPWTSNGSSAPGAAAAAGPYMGAAAPNPYLGSSAGGDALDPARTRRLLARAKRAYDFAAWMSGGPSVRSTQPMGDATAAADAPRSSAPSAGSDEQFDGAVGTPPPQDQFGPARDGLFVQSSGWPFPPASIDAASPPMLVAASDQAPPSIRDPNGGAPIPSPWPDSIFWPGSPSAMQGAGNFIRNIRDLKDALGKWFSLTEQEKEACYKQREYDENQCYENHSYNPTALNGCLERAREIYIQCLRGLQEGRPWTDVDTDGVEIPKKRKR